MRDHRALRAFDLADEIALMTYKITKQFPREEIYGLVSQMRRAAVSVPSNIVEGCSRESRVEYLRFLEIAFGSLRELNYQASLATRLNYLGSPEVESYPEKIEEAEKVLSALIRAVRNPEPLPP
jgi:four helix bundle protein